MLFSTKFLLVFANVLLLSSHLTQAYCVYSELSESTSVYVYEPYVDQRVSFKKTLKGVMKECCAYNNKDCNPSGRRNYKTYMHLRFGFDNEDPFKSHEKHIITCDGGGAFTIYGTNAKDIRYVCNASTGSTFGSLLKYPVEI